ncbi:MAG TPA: protein arginine kinase [Firmicutes bacterium]|nr:protein arginine kinase [Bacillota bacterium]
MEVEDLIRHGGVGWMGGSGAESDVVLSSRVRLARNLEDVPFPGAASDEQREHVYELVRSATQRARGLGNLQPFRLDDLPALDRQILVERHLISPQQADGGRGRGVVIRDDEAVSIMVNEEDHLRIQGFYPGLELERAFELATRFDDFLASELRYAFDGRLGYLTACPTNLGTGLRASVMVHLPALTMAEQMRRLAHGLGQVGLVVRGLYGEGSEMAGSIYQISNQLTLGPTEDEVLSHLQEVTRQVIQQERRARQAMLEQNRVALEDRVWRALGTLRYARRLSTTEALEHLSDVRLGIDLGLITGIAPTILQELLVQIRPAHLQRLTHHEMTAEERDVVRASWIRRRIARALGEQTQA